MKKLLLLCSLNLFVFDTSLLVAKPTRSANSEEYEDENNTQEEYDEPFSFNDEGHAVVFDKNNEPAEYEDGGELGYDDDDNVIIYHRETDEPLGYIIKNNKDEYEFHLYDDTPEGDIATNTVRAAGNAVSGFKKAFKAIGRVFWWSKKKKQQPAVAPVVAALKKIRTSKPEGKSNFDGKKKQTNREREA